MAQCKQTPQDFIRNAFTPQIGVICTPLAEQHCQKNNLSFIELIQPFSKLTSNVYYKDPLGSTVTVKNLQLTFADVNARPPQTSMARKLLNNAVSESADSHPDNVQIGDYSLHITTTTPWFEAWRNTFLKVQYPSDHEYTKHFLCCLLVASASELNVTGSLIELSQTLNQMQTNTPGKLPKWFSSNIFKYYVLIHDNVDGSFEVTNQANEMVKSAYGESNCFLLRMNSRASGSGTAEHLPDPWSQFIHTNINVKMQSKATDVPTRIGSVVDEEPSPEMVPRNEATYHPLSPSTEQLTLMDSPSSGSVSATNTSSSRLHGACLSTEDVEQVKLLLSEFCKSSLMPYVEKQMHLLNENVANKKGVSRSLFSATKRWFNPNKPGSSTLAVNNLVYAPDSAELQVRRLGDLYFMFGNYQGAFQAYHLAKRDYNADQAWLYYAGALEMAALSAFMANESNRKTCDYMEESITTYLNTCKMPQFATRATLLNCECLKNRNMYGEAAHQLIRMTSEDSDLRSALFLEQAAYCFLQSKMVRKYAFHMVLAGHRFSKAAQRKHSLRSYKQARQMYENSGWNLAEDHIHYTVGRQAHNLHSFDEAVGSFAKLLKRDSKQSAQQQGVFLKEYLTVLGNKLMNNENGSELPILALPQLQNRSIKLLMGPTPPLTTPGKLPATGITFTDTETTDLKHRWHKLEEILIQEAQGVVPLIFKPSVTMYTYKNLAKSEPLAVINEPIQMCITFNNPLQIVLSLKDIYPIWIFKGDCIVSNEHYSRAVDDYVKTNVTKSVLVQSDCSQNIVLSMTPLKTGTFILKGVCYTLTSSTGSDAIDIKGKQHLTVKSKHVPKEVEIKIVPLAPCLQVTFSELSLEFLCDEVQKVTIDFHNTGTLPLCKVYMGSAVPHLLCNLDGKKATNVGNADTLAPAARERFLKDNHLTMVTLPNGQLEPGQHAETTIYIRAPSNPKPCVVDLLIYYENVDHTLVPRYRLVRHKWNLTVQESIEIEVDLQSSYNSRETEEMDLVLKTTNLNKIHSSSLTEVNVLNVGMLSRMWQFVETIATPKYVNLNSQESAQILLKAKRISLDDQSLFSNICFTKDTNRTINQAYLAFGKKTEHRQLNMFHEYESNLDENYEGLLLVQWQAVVNDTNRRIVDGQSYISLKLHGKDDDFNQVDEFAALADPANLLEASLGKGKQDNDSFNQCRLTYNFIYPPTVEHNFKESKSCVIPVTLLLHSIEDRKDLDVSINCLGATWGSSIHNRRELFSPFASQDFCWVGAGNVVRLLKNLSSERIQLSAMVCKAGTYDLSTRIEIYAKNNGDTQYPVLQTCQVQSAVIVLDSAN